MRSILEIHPTGNNVSITLNLDPDQLVQLVDGLERLKTLAHERIARLESQSIEVRQEEMKHIHFMGFRIARFARVNGKRIIEVSEVLARQYQISPDCATIRGRVARQHAQRRYMRLRNYSIYRRFQDGEKVEAIAARFDLSKGRVSQIVNSWEMENAN